MLAEQQVQYNVELDRERTEAARRLAERDTLHLGHIERLVTQAAIERALLIERVDAAEIRAERVEQRLELVLDQLLGQREPWWSRWFSRSKRSDLR